MRSLTRHRDEDRGAVLVWVALMLSVLLGVGALVIDAGALYAERRQLQNGADAAALAVAMDCANGNCDLAAGQAGEYANKNANDGAAKVDSVCGVGPGLPACATPPAAAAGKSAWVQVATSTRKPDNSTKVDFVLAPVLDATNVGSTVHASAVATWGPVAGAITLPLAYGICELGRLGMTLDPLFIPTTPGIIYLPGTEPKDVEPPPCADTAPGGFLWLDDNFGPDDCNVKITVGDPMSSDPGKSEPKACEIVLRPGLEVVIPVYDVVPGSGTNAAYHIVGFVGFELTGFDLVHSGRQGLASSECKSNTRCLKGVFKPAVTDGDIGSGANFGATAITMIG